MDLQLLEQTLADRGEPRFRARQVWEWAARGAQGYEEMTNLPGCAARARSRARSRSPRSALQQEAHARDGTVKALFAHRATDARWRRC